MLEHLVVSVHLYDGRYHGTGEWQPSPARLFQALVAGGARGGGLDDGVGGLRWMEGLAPPTIGLPRMTKGQPFDLFVPDNDIDSVGGDLNRIGEIRSSKRVLPMLFDPSVPFLYAWSIGQGAEDHAHAVCGLASDLYQFGRGVDMAWACGEVLDDDALAALLADYPGVVYRPSANGTGRYLPCPMPGSLASLQERHAAGARRFQIVGQGKGARQLFVQPPKPRFRQVAYDSPPARWVYELRQADSASAFGVWPLTRASELVVGLRNQAVAALKAALPEWAPDVERVLVGRKADGADDGPTALRVKIVPLPSIGHPHADHGIRRVLVEVPAGCPIRPDDLNWAFSGLSPVDPATGEILDAVLTPAADEAMLEHYGGADHRASRVWRTVTPAGLPQGAARRRIDPSGLATEAKGGDERSAEQARAAAAVCQALRHAEVRTQPARIRVQREPFEGRGERAEAFAAGTRFAKERLWHVEITFSQPVAGPLVIGDGRFLGLGILAPVRHPQGIRSFAIEAGLEPGAQPGEVARALRRAVMARVQEVLGRRVHLPAYFGGHERDGSPARSESEPHLAFTFDPEGPRLLVIAPHAMARRAPRGPEADYLRILDEALVGFHELRAGAAGLLTLRPVPDLAEQDPLFAVSRTWESVTPYQVTRHAKKTSAADALVADVRAECNRRGFPGPAVVPLEWRGVPGSGLVGRVRLEFNVAIEGPVILGRSRYLGGGLFATRVSDAGS